MKNSEAVKDINYYLSLSYTIVLRPDEEGDVVARIDELPGCVAHGKSNLEALDELESMKKLWIEDCLEGGETVPEPKDRQRYLEPEMNVNNHALAAEAEEKRQMQKRIAELEVQRDLLRQERDGWKSNTYELTNEATELQERIVTLGLQLKASEEREGKLKEALERICAFKTAGICEKHHGLRSLVCAYCQLAARIEDGQDELKELFPTKG